MFSSSILLFPFFTLFFVLIVFFFRISFSHHFKLKPFFLLLFFYLLHLFFSLLFFFFDSSQHLFRSNGQVKSSFFDPLIDYIFFRYFFPSHLFTCNNFLKNIHLVIIRTIFIFLNLNNVAVRTINDSLEKDEVWFLKLP